jgi:hypothetical protein
MPHRSRPVPMLLINVDEVVVELPTAHRRHPHRPRITLGIGQSPPTGVLAAIVLATLHRWPWGGQ